ncbi:MAG: porin family protein [Reichenbachiella sp.]|uniref:porin family protein n=1 Tax=Reichenbachiella sp. TaxID=2184521 RepID=UPI003266880C
MQKAIFIFLVFLGITLSNGANAQRKTYLGVKGGYNLSKAYFFHSFFGSDIVTGFESGFQGGIIAMNYLRNHVGLQAELLYSQKGWRQKFSNGEPDFVTELSYVELPLLVNIYSGKDRLHFFANGGCFVEYLVNVKQSATPSDVSGQEFSPFEESRDNKFGYGFRGGIGTFYDFNFGTILLESSFTYSLSDMMDAGQLSSHTSTDHIPTTSKNMVIGFSLAYMFSFGEL